MAGVLVIGSSNTDLVCRTTSLPRPGETVAGRSFATFPGGKGANQAVAAARAGAAVTFVGAHGDDEFGAARLADLVADGINVSRFKLIEGIASGVAAIVVDERGENQIVYVPGANAEISIADAAAALSEVEHRVISLTFEAPFDVVVHAVQHHPSNSLVVLNAAPFDERVGDLLPDVDVLICNEGEASAILGRPVTTATAIDDAIALRSRGAGAAVITLGADGAVAADPGGSWLTPSPKVSAVDTTGAGDAFCGVLSAWLAAGESLRAAVSAGVAAGALAVTRDGAQPSLPVRDEIVAMLETTGA
ncbi:MAG TPA: ribokinase [Thermomicrobiales bacterium]|nr:ribokinase [Thermomicrobiales bacterium]